MQVQVALSLLLFAAPLQAQAADRPARVPGETWMRYDDVAQAGFDAERLAEAQASWERLPSAAFLVIADGAVVASWGDVERRFMCHSVRKSFLSALFGIYWDRGEIELNKTLADMGLDDTPDPLLETEKQARILDLLKARSGVFHPAAYAGRTDSRPRGSEGPGRFFAYNNWDFNTLAHILRIEAGADVFEAFDEHFAQPLGMQDYRVSDGYYHYERDKSQYPAYPFRMSARDAARFGLLFTRRGDWGGNRILSRHWVRRSTALYSIDDAIRGYGFMWWVFLEPRFERHGMVAAFGVGNQMIAALPDSDLVIVNRADTYRNEGTPTGGLLALVEAVLDARTGEPVAEPRLVPLEALERDPRLTETPAAELEPYAGTFQVPPAVLGRPALSELELRVEGGQLVSEVAAWGSFTLHLQADGTFLEADSLESRYVVRGDQDTGEFAFGNGADVAHLPFVGLARSTDVYHAAMRAAARGEEALAKSSLEILPLEPAWRSLGGGLLQGLSGDVPGAVDTLRALLPEIGVDEMGPEVREVGVVLLESGEAEGAKRLFELCAELFPEAPPAWSGLADAHRALGNVEDAVFFYELALELDPENAAAKRGLAEIRAGGDGR